MGAHWIGGRETLRETLVVAMKFIKRRLPVHSPFLPSVHSGIGSIRSESRTIPPSSSSQVASTTDHHSQRPAAQPFQPLLVATFPAGHVLPMQASNVTCYLTWVVHLSRRSSLPRVHGSLLVCSIKNRPKTADLGIILRPALSLRLWFKIEVCSKPSDKFSKD